MTPYMSGGSVSSRNLEKLSAKMANTRRQTPRSEHMLNKSVQHSNWQLALPKLQVSVFRLSACKLDL